MSTAKQHPHVYEFMNRIQTAVLSTTNDHGKPWGSAIYYVVDENLNTYFVTRVGTAKYKNLEAHPYVALTVLDAANQTTVQLAGKISKLPAHDYKEIVFDKLARIRPDDDNDWAPPIEKVHKGDYIALKITPTKLQFADYSKPYKKFDQTYIENII